MTPFHIHSPITFSGSNNSRCKVTTPCNGFYPHWLSDMKFALLAIIWWARVVPTHLLPKKMDLQSIAVADLLLTHIKFIAFLYLQAAFTLDVNGSGSVYSRKD